jgi:hypothetical protein
MTRFIPLFSPEELEQLDDKQREILEGAILHEIRTSPEILEILRGRVRPVYERWTSRGRPASARASRPRRPRGSTT